jgi:cytidine deaminase
MDLDSTPGSYAVPMTIHTDPELFEAARRVQANAHVPYSQFRVGAAVRSSSGRVFAGCNVENAAYPQGWCAEASAIAAMVSAGDREIVAVLTICDGDQLSTCCGGCRQKIREFAAPGLVVHAAGPDGIRKSYTMDELLPDSFGPEHLVR